MWLGIVGAVGAAGCVALVAAILLCTRRNRDDDKGLGVRPLSAFDPAKHGTPDSGGVTEAEEDDSGSEDGLFELVSEATPSIVTNEPEGAPSGDVTEPTAEGAEVPLRRIVTPRRVGTITYLSAKTTLAAVREMSRSSPLINNLPTGADIYATVRPRQARPTSLPAVGMAEYKEELSLSGGDGGACGAASVFAPPPALPARRYSIGEISLQVESARKTVGQQNRRRSRLTNRATFPGGLVARTQSAPEESDFEAIRMAALTDRRRSERESVEGDGADEPDLVPWSPGENTVPDAFEPVRDYADVGQIFENSSDGESDSDSIQPAAVSPGVDSLPLSAPRGASPEPPYDDPVQLLQRLQSGTDGTTSGTSPAYAQVDTVSTTAASTEPMANPEELPHAKPTSAPPPPPYIGVDSPFLSLRSRSYLDAIAPDSVT